MGSDPLTIKRPVNIYNLPNARDSAHGLSPLPSSLSSAAPAFPRPPAAEAGDSGVVDRNFGGKAADFGRYPPDLRAGKARRFSANIPGGFR